MKPYKNIDEYISNFPPDVQSKLKELRATIKELVPTAGEKISYGIPAATLDGRNLVYFAGYKKHISMYPVTSAIEQSVKGVDQYRTGKGTLQFPLDTPLPMDFIRSVISTRLNESMQEKS